MSDQERIYFIFCPPYKESLYQNSDGTFSLVANLPMTAEAKRIFDSREIHATGKQTIPLTRDEAYSLAFQIVPHGNLSYFFD